MLDLALDTRIFINNELDAALQELDMIFNSISEANAYMSENYGYKKLKISEVCNGKRLYTGKLKDGTKLHWIYVD